MTNNFIDFSDSVDVKSIQYDGNTYTGKVIVNNQGIQVPHGYGRLTDREGQIVQGYFVNGHIYKVALKTIGKHTMFMGQINEDGEPDGMCYQVCCGRITFGLYKKGVLYYDLSFLGQYLHDVFKHHYQFTTEWSKESGFAFSIGLSKKEGHGFTGLIFYENDELFLGINCDFNFHSLTGAVIQFLPYNNINYAQLEDGIKIKTFNVHNFLDQFNLFDNIDYVDNIEKRLKDYRYGYKDSRLYYIIAANPSHLDMDIMHVFTYIEAVPIRSIQWDRYSGEISFKEEDIEYFYFDKDEYICESIKINSNRHFLQIHLEDYHMYKGCVDTIFSEEIKSKKHIHWHNGLEELDYLNILEWDPLSISERMNHIRAHKLTDLYTRELKLDPTMSECILDIDYDNNCFDDDFDF